LGFEVDHRDLSGYLWFMKKIVEQCNDPKKLEIIRQNALDLADDAFRKMCLLRAGKRHDQMNADYYQALEAYEWLLKKYVAPTAFASRTREALAKRPLIDCLEEWAGAKTPTKAFDMLVKYGYWDMVAERIIHRYPEHFSAKTLDVARKRLEGIGRFVV